MTEPTRPLPPPTIDTKDGSLVAHSVATPRAFKVRGLLRVPAEKVIPVIFVPGIMGTNLKVRPNAVVSNQFDLKPGEAAWRPPNGLVQGITEVRRWLRRDPIQRQKILSPALLEVDRSGDLPESSLKEEQMRQQGWGEVHVASYGALLARLQEELNTTFEQSGQQRKILPHWRKVIGCAPSRWGVRNIAPLTEDELLVHAGHYFPVYAVGYNWLQSCAVSAERLRERVLAIIKEWNVGTWTCKHVILVSHSMGGLVARACAKQIPAQVLGVIHGVMPAYGAPVAYRRIACGTEGGRFNRDIGDNVPDELFAVIAGRTAEETTPVMAVSPGVLELLPNQYYPAPWLSVKTVRTVNKTEQYRDVLNLPQGNPYDFYRDTQSWYRMIDPALADPAKDYARLPGGVAAMISKAIGTAEQFHRSVLADGPAAGGSEAATTPSAKAKPYYHPRTYAYYGADEEHRSFGQIRWVATEPNGQNCVITDNNLKQAHLSHCFADGTREVQVEGRFPLRFRPWLQDAAGDDTVPYQSGAGAAAGVLQAFRMQGYSHQGSFQHEDVILLTQYLIAKIVQSLK